MKAITMKRAMAIAIVLSCMNGATAFAAEPDPKTVAGEHYQRGVKAFKANRFGEAASEFRTAYETLPAYPVLYNIGQVDVALGDAVGAVDAFEKYLSEGGSKIPKERKQAVEVELEKQRARIGTIVLQVQPEGAEVRVDGKLIGKAPLSEPLRLTEGKREIVVIASGYDTRVRELEVASKSQAEIEIKLDRMGGKDDNGPTVVSPLPMPAPPPAVSNPPPAAPTMLANSTAPKEEHETSNGNTQRTVGYVVGTVGLGVAGSGLVLAITSANKASSAKNRMAGTTIGTEWDSAKADYDSAKSNNKLGWAGLGLGTAALVGGIVLIVTAPTTKSSTAWAVTPWNTAHAGGVMAETCF